MAGRNIDAALAVLPYSRLRARARQQHADLQRRVLRAHDIERGNAGDDAGAQPGGHRAARYAIVA